MNQTYSQINGEPHTLGEGSQQHPKKTPKKHIQVVTTASLRRHLFQPLWFVVVVVAVVFLVFSPKLTGSSPLHFLRRAPKGKFHLPLPTIFRCELLVSWRVADLQVDIHIRAEPFPKNPWLNREFQTWAQLTRSQCLT